REDVGRLRGAARAPVPDAGRGRGHRRRDAREHRRSAPHVSSIGHRRARARFRGPRHARRRVARPVHRTCAVRAMSDLVVERAAAPARLTLNRPEKRNALSVALRDAISDALDDLAGDEQMKCVVFTGAGAVFSSGFDLKEFTKAADDDAFARELWASSDRYHDTVLRFPLPTIAAVNGPALAGGFDLAILCDLRIASTTARFAHPQRTF